VNTKKGRNLHGEKNFTGMRGREKLREKKGKT